MILNTYCFATVKKNKKKHTQIKTLLLLMFPGHQEKIIVRKASRLLACEFLIIQALDLWKEKYFFESDTLYTYKLSVPQMLKLQSLDAL